MGESYHSPVVDLGVTSGMAFEGYRTRRFYSKIS
jgi:hypothetical protein